MKLIMFFTLSFYALFLSSCANYKNISTSKYVDTRLNVLPKDVAIDFLQNQYKFISEPSANHLSYVVPEGCTNCQFDKEKTDVLKLMVKKCDLDLINKQKEETMGYLPIPYNKLGYWGWEDINKRSLIIYVSSGYITTAQPPQKAYEMSAHCHIHLKESDKLAKVINSLNALGVLTRKNFDNKYPKNTFSNSLIAKENRRKKELRELDFNQLNEIYEINNRIKSYKTKKEIEYQKTSQKLKQALEQRDKTPTFTLPKSSDNKRFESLRTLPKLPNNNSFNTSINKKPTFTLPKLPNNNSFNPPTLPDTFTLPKLPKFDSLKSF